MNERGDLVLRDSGGSDRKMSTRLPHPALINRTDNPLSRVYISGSAYKIVSQRAYHHGTMLVSSNLAHLGKYLRPKTVRPLLSPSPSCAYPILRNLGTL